MFRRTSGAVYPRIVLLGAVAAISVLAGCGGGGSDSTATGVGSAQGAGEQALGFGQEGSPGDRAAATKAVQGFLHAVAANEPARACSLMSASTKRNLAVFASQLKSQGCTGQLEAVRSQMPARVLAQFERVQMTGFRLEGGHGLVLYRDAGGTRLAYPVVREGNAWKVAAIAGSSLP